ncbi:MAG: V-type ATP synthase subunit A [Eubacterium sp.]|nr:V-type ATP synthase subunit A [Eubacterium sp.]
MNKIYAINGPVIKVKASKAFSMLEMVYVGNKKLIGEVIGIDDEYTVIQVYEETAGMKVGEPVEPTGGPLCANLGPGIVSGIFDGIERPLTAMRELSGAFVTEGSAIESLDQIKKYNVTVNVQVGDKVNEGEIFARCPETALIEHRCMIPPGIKDWVVFYAKSNGQYTVIDEIIKIKSPDGSSELSLTMTQRWPIRKPRPMARRKQLEKPLITGQRIIDTVLPVAKGGTAAIPGGFGTGKTMTQHQVAKWCDADIIVYIGCGERGNEMTQVLTEFAELIDPKSGRPLTDRTVLIANTSNMPVAAREASIYTGMTLAEYYRDMGYHIAIMADSTSRWAEALREISARLEEMPAEEGFPAYLPSRLAEFYERAGYVETLSGDEGSVTIIGAVSPQGSDFSEPVTQNTKRFVRCFWALDKSLAYSRHYPAIHWLTSYSEYIDDLEPFYKNNVGDDFIESRQRIQTLLIEESKLVEIVKLIGEDVLPDDQKLIMAIAKVIRVGFLQQNAFHKDDTFVPLKKQLYMMRAILKLYDLSNNALRRGVVIRKITESGWFEKLIKMKYDIPNENYDIFDLYDREINLLFSNL